MRLGDVVEVSMPNGYAYVNTKGILVEIKGDEYTIRFAGGRYHTCDKHNVHVPGSPGGRTTCKTCLNTACWIDYGSSVGKGWYCKSCKQEVDSPDNVYGISGKEIKANTPKLSSVQHPVKNFEPLCCMKQTCGVCKGTKRAVVEPLGIQLASSIVRCIVDGGSKKLLKARQEYTVASVDPNGNLILWGMPNEVFSRCRFEIQVPSTAPVFKVASKKIWFAP